MNTPVSLSAEEALQKRQGAPPFTFTMTDARGRTLRLHCAEVIKRRVFRTSWKGREALAKLYSGSKALQTLSYETRAYKMLRRAGLPTPELLHATEGADRRYALLVFAYLPNAVTASDALQNAKNRTEQMRVAEQILALFAAMHRHGLRQTEYHLGHFLFCANRLYAVDLGTVLPMRRKWTPTNNVTSILTRMPASMRSALLQFLREKCRIKLHPRQIELQHWRDIYRTRRMVCGGIHHLAVVRKRDRLTAYRLHRYRQSDILRKIVSDPEAAAARGEILQQGGGRRTVRLAAEDDGLILQCYDPPHGLQALRPSRAWRSWLNRHLLTPLWACPDIRLSQLLACVEERRGPLRGRSWLIHKPLPGESLAAVTRAGAPQTPIDAALQKIFVVFYALQMLPQDLSADGFIVHEGEVSFTALEDMRHFHRRSACARAWPAMQRAFVDNWPASHPCHARYREMLEAIPQESSL